MRQWPPSDPERARGCFKREVGIEYDPVHTVTAAGQQIPAPGLEIAHLGQPGDRRYTIDITGTTTASPLTPISSDLIVWDPRSPASVCDVVRDRPFRGRSRTTASGGGGI